MMNNDNSIFTYRKSEPRWINFENHSGEKGKGGMENHGAKGHPFESFEDGEEKVLCDFEGHGVIRRMWIALSDRSEETIKNITLKMFWDDEDEPSVNVPLCDFFCMGLGVMRQFENRFFTTGNGNSFVCKIPMPFRKHAKILICNNTGKRLSHLFYEINLTLEELPDDVMYFGSCFKEVKENELEKNVTILNLDGVCGRYLGANIAVYPNKEKYLDTWWGEGEVKIYIDGDSEYPTLCGTGTEDYSGASWEIEEFINDCGGCVTKIDNAASMYRFHVGDEIYFKNNIRVELPAMGGANISAVKEIMSKNVTVPMVTYDPNGTLNQIYKKDVPKEEIFGWVNFYRQDSFRTVAYYYILK